MKWISENYKKMIVNLLTSILVVLVAFWVANSDTKKTNIVKDIEALKIEKATYPYVDAKYKEMLEINKEQDARFETFRKENREDHKEIMEGQKEIMEIIRTLPMAEKIKTNIR